MQGFIFGGEGLPKTPQELARLRSMAQTIAPSRAPKDVGEGLNAIGNAILYRSLVNKADKGEAAGAESANSAADLEIAKAYGAPAAPTVDASGFPSAPQTPSAPMTMPTGDMAQTVRSGLIERGLPEHVADAFVVNFQDESGLNPGINEAKPLVPGSRGGFGLYQLTGPRRVAYEQFAQQRGVSPDDTNAQLDFLMLEGQGSEKAAFDKILAAPDKATAAQTIVKDFLRPAPEHRDSRMARYAGLSSQGQAQFDPARMPPQGQPIAQGRDALAQALMQQQTGAAAPQAIEQIMAQAPRPQAANAGMVNSQRSDNPDPSMGDPRTQFNSPQLNAADPASGILKVLMERGGQQTQANPAAAKVQQAMQGQSQGANLDMNKAIELMNNPFLDPGKKQVLGAMLERQMQAQDPVRQMQLEKGRLELEQMRNPQPKATDDIREYEFAKSQGFPGSYLDFQTSLKKAGATNVTTNLGEGDKFYENLDKKNAETFSALSDTGMQSRSKLAQIERLDGLLATAPQGASAILKQAAGEYGINTEGLSDIQAAQALINELVPQQRQPGSGPMSDADLALFKQSLPRLINQPEGNKAIIDTMRGITQYQIQMGEIADAVSNREMKPAEGRKAIAGLQNPLEGFGKIAKGTSTPTPPANKPISEMTDEELEALANGN
jgi:hypothetical protein